MHLYSRPSLTDEDDMELIRKAVDSVLAQSMRSSGYYHSDLT